MAPEILQSINDPTPEGDVYSFAIISSEIITRKSAWNLTNRQESVDGKIIFSQEISLFFLELIYLIKKGGHQPIRPDLATDDLEINSALVINYSNKLNLTNTPN